MSILIQFPIEQIFFLFVKGAFQIYFFKTQFVILFSLNTILYSSSTFQPLTIYYFYHIRFPKGKNVVNMLRLSSRIGDDGGGDA
jgi:hypothetical protein